MTAGSLVLSLFPGIGLLDMAFEEEGFCVVRGPDLLWGGDIRAFHPPADRFDGVIGGPPCRAFTPFVRFSESWKHPPMNLIPEFERVVAEAQPAWFLMENVTDAPTPSVDGYTVDTQVIEDAQVGGETRRLRRFWFGTTDGRRLDIETLALFPEDVLPPVTSSNGTDQPGRQIPRWEVEDALEAQGLSRDHLDRSPFTKAGKRRVIANGVPLPMGRAVARAVSRAVSDAHHTQENR